MESTQTESPSKALTVQPRVCLEYTPSRGSTSSPDPCTKVGTGPLDRKRMQVDQRFVEGEAVLAMGSRERLRRGKGRLVHSEGSLSQSQDVAHAMPRQNEGKSMFMSVTQPLASPR